MADFEWSPDPQGVEHITNLLKQSMTGNTEVHRRVHQELEELNKRQDFFLYLAHIFINEKELDLDLRRMAGFALKARIKAMDQRLLDMQVVHQLQALLMSDINDNQQQIRSTIGTVLAAITAKTEANLESVISGAIEAIDSGDGDAVHGGFLVLTQVCEDNVPVIERSEYRASQNAIVERMLLYMQHDNAELRGYAIHVLLLFFDPPSVMPQTLLASMPKFLENLFNLANDSSAYVRQHVCASLVALTQRWDMVGPHLGPYFESVVEYMLESSKESDEEVAINACEFWTVACESEAQEFDLRPYMDRLVPILLNNMVYSEMQQIMLTNEEEEDESVPDRPEDINPRAFHHQSRQAGVEDGEEDDQDDDEDDMDAMDGFGEWNLRKCSASSLDMLAVTYGNDILPHLLPHVQQGLNSQDWPIRESVILALGAVAEGCIGMKEYLPELVPFLHTLLHDKSAAVRCITFWTVSRYSRFIIAHRDGVYMETTLEKIMNGLLDRNKKVQQAACSAFSTFVEDAHREVMPYLSSILPVLAQCFSRYQAKNVLTLYDAVCTLAETVGQDLNRPEFIPHLLPPLFEKWNETPDSDMHLFPLLECFGSLASALGDGFKEYAPPVFERCVNLVAQTLQAIQMARSSGDDEPDKEIIACALDVLSGLAEGLGPSIETLVSGTPLVDLLLVCMQENSEDVRTSSFALVGDLAKACIGHIRPSIEQMVSILSKNLVPTFTPVCNNAVWSLGEIAVKLGEEMKPFIPPILPRLVELMNSVQLNRNLLENTAITLGRLGWVCPAEVVPQLANFLPNWCLSLRRIRDIAEKEQAFKGLCAMIRLSPQSAIPSFAYVCDAIASWEEPEPALRQEFYDILQGFKNSMGNEWESYFSRFPNDIAQPLRANYNL
eukprot:gb/GECH01013629.1/.p1 GENE.gb/GECH01013629.1/~~gb/GECH01013629.1/.p1  ORF type:complete len:894 (+),score=181.29 gb/GECH01013629.1/:1-2682(+)